MDSMKRVVLGMSGGTDSSVAAMLLMDAGYEVTGVTFRFYEVNGSTGYLDDARELAGRLGIDHVVYDARELFRKTVMDYFVREYMAGRTPVPCVVCNNCLKWPLLARMADERSIGRISTGHYVRTMRKDGRFYIACGIDEEKDQSFFLWGLKQELISRMILPLGDLTKKRVREIAKEKGFQRIAGKKDSLGVCFCPMDYRSFLMKETDHGQIVPGDFIDEAGNYIARHRGYPFYTVGQRRGLGLHLNKPVFVKEIIPEKNKVVLAGIDALERTEIWLKEWNLVDPGSVLGQDDVTVRVRYRKQSDRCTVSIGDAGLLHVCLFNPVTAIAAGQAAAFYRGDVLLGGGIIYR